MELPLPLQRMLLDMHVAHHEAAERAAKANPVAHKLTLVWPTGSRCRWLYYDGGVSRGVRRRFCYTTTRNAAGYFLSFVEVYHVKKGVGRRTKFKASRTRRLMDERAERMWKAWLNRKR